MIIFTEKADVQAFASKSAEHSSVGFVPTMGALHMGHFSLFEKCRAENGICIASIFVNPLQFNDKDDFNAYPSTPESDLEILKNAGFDAVFMPNASSFFEGETLPEPNLGSLNERMEGLYRPGHFEGVYQVVHLLFSYIKPHFAYFGQKDYQQVAVIRNMVKQEGHNTQIIACQTIREMNGLAMSSRNRRLSPQMFDNAAKVSTFLLNLNPTLTIEAKDLKEQFDALLHSLGLEPEYIEICNPHTLEPIPVYTQGPAVVCIAYYAGDVRLIDNVIWEN